MSIEIPEKCPKCGEAVRNTKKDWVQFECWSERYRDESGLNPDRQSGKCLLNERHLLTKRVAELERERDHANDTASAVLKDEAVLRKRVAELEEALRLIANMDYRGNRSTESLVALEALKAKGQP